MCIRYDRIAGRRQDVSTCRRSGMSGAARGQRMHNRPHPQAIIPATESAITLNIRIFKPMMAMGDCSRKPTAHTPAPLEKASAAHCSEIEKNVASAASLKTATEKAPTSYELQRQRPVAESGCHACPVRSKARDAPRAGPTECFAPAPSSPCDLGLHPRR